MNIYEFADMIDRDLVITRFANQKNRFVCSFENTETKRFKEDGILSGTYGNGSSPSSAIKDYVNQLRDKLLVIDATSPSRKEFQVPKNLRVA